MYCKNCGKELSDSAVYCTRCGVNQHLSLSEQDTTSKTVDISEPPPPAPPAPAQTKNPIAATPGSKEKDGPSFLFGLLSFFQPIIGLVLFLVWKDTLPLRARSCGIAALVSVIISFVIGIIGYSTIFLPLIYV